MASIKFEKYSTTKKGGSSIAVVDFQVSGLCDSEPILSISVAGHLCSGSVDEDILQAKIELATRLAQLRAPLIAEIESD